MSLSLIEALRQVDLEPGRTYRCRVKGRTIELHVGEVVPEKLSLPDVPDIPPYDDVESCGMLDPWVELPSPKPIGTVIARFALPSPPDIPEIPNEDDVP